MLYVQPFYHDYTMDVMNTASGTAGGVVGLGDGRPASSMNGDEEEDDDDEDDRDTAPRRSPREPAAHRPPLIPGCVLACSVEPRCAQATGKRPREATRAPVLFGVLVQCLQTHGVRLSGRSVRVLFPAQASEGAAGIAQETTKIVPEARVRLVASSADACAADGSAPAGYDAAVRWLFENKRWEVSAHLDALARMLVGGLRPCRPPLDAVCVLSVGEGTGVATHIFNDVLAHTISEISVGGVRAVAGGRGSSHHSWALGRQEYF